LFGVPMGRSEHFINDIIGVIKLIGDTHMPTLAIGVLAIAIMWGLRKYAPKMPGVLIAVVVTTLLSWAVGFERNAAGAPEQIADPELLAVVQQSMAAAKRVDDLNTQIAEKSAALKAARKASGEESVQVVQMEAELGLARIEVRAAEDAFSKEKAALRHLQVVRSTDANGATLAIYRADQAPQGVTLDETRYRLRKLTAKGFTLVGGGEVVGLIPAGLPSIKMPTFNLDALGSLLSAALVISLVGFMEAISIAKAIAAKTRQRLDPNQELIGQGLANVVGSFTQAFPVSGSFSRSAVNMNSGAKTGMSSVITALIVLVALLFLTPLLYHLPQAVLAAIIIMAVIGLVNFQAVKHAWQASRHDGVAAGVTFFATLAFAPHLDKGIMVGAGLALGLYLYRTMKPRVAILGRYKDGTLRDIRVNPDLPTSRHMVAIRFDGSLYFANVAYFEDAILEAVANDPDAKYVLVVGDGINQLDASGEEVIHHLVERLHSIGITLVFSGLKKQVLDVMHATGLFDMIGRDKVFATEEQAIAAIYEQLGESGADDLFYTIKPSR
jgi:SulP family sulfate permease